MIRWAPALLFLACLGAQQVDADAVLDRANKSFDEAKAAYDGAAAKGSAEAFIDAGFKLEEARIKFLVLQEVGSPEKQKIAADRLRAVNQLGKLIHDGRVAISGSPAETPSAKPSEPSASPVPNTPAPAPGVVVDVSKRLPVPDAAKQKEAEKLIRDLFKEQYAKKTPADRKTLIKSLLDQAAKSQDDPVALWVFYREAQDLSIQACDARSAVEAVDLSARTFDVDATALKNTALAAAAKSAKTPEEWIDLAEAQQKLVEEFVRADQFDAADKAAAAALQLAKRSTDTGVIAQATLRAKEAAEAKVLFQAMKSVLHTQASNPDDPGANLEIGRFLCFVKGTWDLGLRFIVKGSDASLKALATKELALPVQSVERAALADGWYELMEKEKSPLRKSQLLSHAKSIYASALPNATALIRAKIEKRLAEMEDPGGAAGPRGYVELLKLIIPAKDSKDGQLWKIERGVLINPKGGTGPSPLINIPYVPPDEYDLSIVVERTDPGDFFKFGIMSGPNMVSVVIDTQGKSGLQNLDVPMWGGGLLPQGKPIPITVSVRRNSFLLVVDGKKIFDLKKGFDRPSGEAGYPNGLYIQACASVFAVSKFNLTPISGGTGRKTR